MATRELSIFPLPIVLFPTAPQLLHVFEPRYRQLLADCEKGDRRFGVSFVQPELTEDALPAPGSVGCRAFVKSVRRVPDGRSNILVVGEQRYVIQRFVESDRLYRVAEVQPFDDDPWEVPDVEQLAADVGDAFQRFAAAVRVLNDEAAATMELPNDASVLSFQIAAALDLEPAVKQGLLELRSVDQRLRCLRDHLLGLNADIKERAEVHRAAKRNGRGRLGRPPPIEDR